jgi:acetyl-CoA carboxylase carboxyl transferase subunit beta
MVDMVVSRHQLRATLANLCRLLTKAPASSPMPAADETPIETLPAPTSA